jgi:hypothetical protein
MPAEGDDDGLLLGVRTKERASFGLMRASVVVARLRHFWMVVGLML